MRPALQVVDNTLPDPPYPAETKSRGWRFEIDHERLLVSDTWTLCPPEIRGPLVLVWLLSWTRIPCGSWPADDRVIATAIGLSLTAFQNHRDLLMRGWMRHADGRLYHPVVSEQVLALVNRRTAETKRKAEFRDKRKQECPVNVPRDSQGTAMGIHTPVPVPEPVPVKEKKTPLSGTPDVTKPDDWDFTKLPPEGMEAHFILAFLNRVSKSRFEATEAHLRLIRPRIKEAGSLAAVKRTIAYMAQKWEDDPKMGAYLRPKTLFAALNFAGYLEEARKHYEKT